MQIIRMEAAHPTLAQRTPLPAKRPHTRSATTAARSLLAAARHWLQDHACRPYNSPCRHSYPSGIPPTPYQLWTTCYRGRRNPRLSRQESRLRTIAAPGRAQEPQAQAQHPPTSQMIGTSPTTAAIARIASPGEIACRSLTS